ncbi:unnamed protein product [Mytilus coruscus]|uniref:B box-type domain-containing protein n=1 Tax=Mytilus coruscus TaxID=42192 RepID=A0A6J8CF15_MYTCO|nr:unnamed protein product [Mytilus coruscus]
MTSMLDELAIDKSKKQCSSCQDNNESKNARSWCSICEEAYCEHCEKYHKSLKVLSKHKLIYLQEIQTGNCDIQIFEVLSCEEHQDHLVEVYCTDHSKPCCTLCVTFSHRQCKNVISIKKAASGSKQSTKTSGLSERLNDHLIDLSEVIDNRNQNLADVKNSR